MDITLERILSLIPKKPDGKYVHGAKKDFADSLGLARNLVTMWESGQSASYNNYLYEISAKYNVSVEWLKGETDIKEKLPAEAGSLREQADAIINNMSNEELLELIARATEKLRQR